MIAFQIFTNCITTTTHIGAHQKKLFLQPQILSSFNTDQYSSCMNSFTVNAQGTEKSGDGKITCTIRSPTGKKIHNSVDNNNDGTYKVNYILPEEGKFF